MAVEPDNGRVLKRRHVLSLLALTLPAACATEQPTELLAGRQLTPTPPPTPSLLAAPSPTASPSASASASPSAAPTATKTTEAARAAARGGAVPFQPGKAMLGSYLDLGGKSLSQSLSLRRSQLGRGQRIVHRFYPWEGYVPTSEPAISRDSILLASWHGAKYGPINNGSADRNIASVARKLKGMKRPILLRWGWEMNGNWFEWDGSHNGNSPASYVKAWRRIHRIFGENGADNIAWVWSPNWNSSPSSAWNRVQAYYPGDEYVDWVGISGYNFYGESPRTLFNPITKAYGGRKPIILSETAAVQGRAAWIKQLSAWVKDTPSVGAVVWFDTDVQHDSDHNFRPDVDPASLAAYRAMARSARFSG